MGVDINISEAEAGLSRAATERKTDTVEAGTKNDEVLAEGEKLAEINGIKKWMESTDVTEDFLNEDCPGEQSNPLPGIVQTFMTKVKRNIPSIVDREKVVPE
ncbi:hypothetical protein LXL04_012982 [Taraxacum kok-saghyz]